MAAAAPEPLASTASSDAWFVYLFALSDCSSFKVGFTCHPLQRISTFSRRYYERFDLSQSLLLQLETCDDARVLEAAIKTELAAYRAVAPEWIPPEAGGQTEWFSAVYFGQAESRLRTTALDPARLQLARDYLGRELGAMRLSFEVWAWAQAQQTSQIKAAARRGYRVHDAGRSLRDWLDAYAYFDVSLFVDDPAVRSFVQESVRR
jgi:T5orf172 domain